MMTPPELAIARFALKYGSPRRAAITTCNVAEERAIHDHGGSANETPRP
jgi:hypothetical protein